MIPDWLIFAVPFLSLVGTGTRSYVIQSVVDDTMEEEIRHGYNIAVTHRTCTLVWFFDYFRLYNLSFSSVIHPTRKHFFEKISFLDPHLFRLTKTFRDDTSFGGSDDPP